MNSPAVRFVFIEERPPLVAGQGHGDGVLAHLAPDGFGGDKRAGHPAQRGIARDGRGHGVHLFTTCSQYARTIVQQQRAGRVRVVFLNLSREARKRVDGQDAAHSDPENGARKNFHAGARPLPFEVTDAANQHGISSPVVFLVGRKDYPDTSLNR